MAVPFFEMSYALGEGARADLLKRWDAVLAHGRFINGPEVSELESALAAFLGVDHVVACSNGSDALVMALRAAGVGPGDEVVVPAFTFFATGGAVARTGATPVFADIDPMTFNLDPASAASKVTARTKAVLPVHLYGRPAPIGELRTAVSAAAEQCSSAPPLILEDAAQAVAAVSEEGPCGGLGFAAGFSCFPTKNLGACGDAGFVTTNDEGVAEHLRRIKEHGGGRQYFHDEVGFNFRHDTLQAAALLSRLPQLPVWNAARSETAAAYTEGLQALGCSSTAGPLRTPESVPGHVWHQYVLRVPEHRDALQAFLADRGIGSAVYYPLPLHLQPCFAHLGGKVGDLPGCEQAAAEVLALPIYPGVGELQRAEVLAGLGAFLEELDATP